jgi:hypothetical protein
LNLPQPYVITQWDSDRQPREWRGAGPKQAKILTFLCRRELRPSPPADRLSSRPATRPPDRPPDPEIGSPGAVRTATGVEIQKSLLLRTTPKYRNQHTFVQSATVAVYESQQQVGAAAVHAVAFDSVDDDQDCDVDGGVERDGEHRAYTITGRHVDTVQSGPEVARAIPSATGTNNTEALNKALAR